MINSNAPCFNITENDFEKFCADGCIICHDTDIYETIDNSRTVTKADIIKTECQHLYHIECLIRYIIIANNDEQCALCRRKIVETISNLRPIAVNRSINKMAVSNNPQGVLCTISKNPSINIDIEILNLGLTNALKEGNIRKIKLWVKAGANNSIVIQKNLKDLLENTEEEIVLELINLKIKFDDPSTINLILQYLAKKNQPALFNFYSGCSIPRSYQNILQQGINTAANQNAFTDAETWITNGAILTTETIILGLKQAVACENTDSFEQWLYLASLHKIKKVNTAEILKIGLQQVANANKPYLAKKWIAFGANKDINTLNTGLEAAAKTGDYQSAEVWLDIGATRNIALLSQGYINADFEHKIFWQKLGAIPPVNELNLELKTALANNDFIKAMLLFKRGAVASIDDMKAVKERMSNNQAWQKLINKYFTKVENAI